MNRIVKSLLIIVSVIAFLICILCCLYIWQYFRGNMLNEQMEELVLPSANILPDPAISADPEDTVITSNVDFAALSEINEEIYAWIEVPGTNISYAVVQSASNDLFYNNHAIDKSYYTGGSIFSQRYNSTNFQDPVTVLYGHNRQSKTMFSPLNDFASKEVFDVSPLIYIYTSDVIYQYEIFAAYPHSSEHLLLCHDFTDEAEFTAYFDSLSDGINCNYRRDLFPSPGDQVITLSTCYRSNRLQRYLVQGVLTAEYPVSVAK